MELPSPAALRSGSRALRWALGVGLGVVAALSLVLLFLLAQATGNRELYERYYAGLFGLNVSLALLLLAVIVWLVLRMGLRLRQRKFGSRLLVKLAAIFALVGLLPGVMIYLVSYQFVTRSIESWFDVRVESALNAGLQLGRVTLDRMAADLGSRARLAARQVAEAPDGGTSLTLERVREQLGVREVTLWSASGQLLASASDSRTLLGQAERPSSSQMRLARSQSVATQIDGLDDVSAPSASAGVPRARIRAVAPVSLSSVDLSGGLRYLQLSEELPADLVGNAMAVQEANREYQERALARDGLKRMYIGTLTLALFLAVFGAILLAVVLGTQLAKPLLVLAEGVRQVARGDLRPTTVLQSRDELGGLTRSFAEMTQQLADARSAVQASMSEVDAARASLQTILDNLTAGVMVLDGQGRILSCNPGATRILRAPLAAFVGRPLAEVPGLQLLGEGVRAQFQAFLQEQGAHGLAHWQQSFELPLTSGGADNRITLIARGAAMPGTEDCLLVFDDVSDVVSAQRIAAWGEVARRLAHEIKNPLTPIQLSAERLERKLSGRLEPADQQVLAKSVKTIVDQVDAMKRLVNEFRDYARLPAADLKPVDLNAVVSDVMQLYPPEQAGVPVRMELQASLPPVMGDAQQLRQVIHNLLQNAQDAHEGRPADRTAPPLVLVRTEYAPASQRVRLVVRDHGSGFPENILKRVFEPYVTTKAKGTGLGLAVVRKIVDEHHARIDISNRVSEGVLEGAQVSLSFPVATGV